MIAMRKQGLFVASMVVAVALSSPAAAQQDGGLAGLHDKVRVGNKICMADHFHTGSSAGQPSRRQAESAAIADWAGFTAWEYGNNWANFGMAESKTMTCQQAGGWSCSADARACRRR